MLITVTGPDRPGVSSVLFTALTAHGVELLDLEQELIDRADVVFTGGSSLFEAKKDRHPNVHCFPSSVDRVHFLKARARQFDPGDQEDLPLPRLGFYGVIDERFDTELLDKDPRKAVEKAVRGMLPHNRLGRQLIKKLKVYSGPVHPHDAQQPAQYELSQVAQ